MSILGKIGAVFSGGVVETVQKGADIVERWAPGAEAKHEMAVEIDKAIEQSRADARNFAAPGESPGVMNAAMNAVNRSVRPVTTYWIFGGLAGFWTLPSTSEVDPVILNIATIIVGFWFGGRAIFKDLPGAIRYLREVRK